MGRTARTALNLEALKRAFFENAARADAPAGPQSAVTLEAVAAATGLDIRRAPSRATRKAKAAAERIQGRS